MHFKTIKRDEVLPMIEQAKDKKEQKKALCDLIACTPKELEALINELKAERAERKAREDSITKKVARDDELAEVAAYAKKLEIELERAKNELRDADCALKTAKELIAHQSDRYDKLAEEKAAVLDTLANALALISSLQRLAKIGGAKG